MRKLLVLLFLPVLYCTGNSNSKDDKFSIFENLGLTIVRNNRATISGTAVKGILKNGSVTINSLNADGTCNASSVLASSVTDELGKYSLFYNRTGGFACLIVSGDANGKTTMFDEKSNADVAVSSTSNYKLTTIIQESKITAGSRKNVLASPFSFFAASRFQSLLKQAGNEADRNVLYKKASKEVVIRFGLNTGLSTISGKSSANYKNRQAKVSDSDYPDLEDIAIELENPKSPLSAKYISVLTGFSYLASKYKKDSKVSLEDINSVVNAFASDFEDGLFDGKGNDGKPITIGTGTGTNQVTLSSTPLTSTLLPSMISYIQEGGKLTTGSPSTSTVNITESQISSQIQFVDSAPIIPTPGSTAPVTSAEDTAIAVDKAALAITYGGSDTATSVTQNVTLPVTGSSGTTIAWTSTNTNLIANNGTVNRLYIVDAVVILTATISKSGGTSNTKVFNLTVIKRDGTGTTASRVYGQPSFLTNSTGTSASLFNLTADVTQDAFGGVYIVDQNNNRVLYYPSFSTTPARVYGQGGSYVTGNPNNGGTPTADSLNAPYGVTADATGVYIVDMGNHRVLYYAGSSTTATRVYGQGGNFTGNTPSGGTITADNLNMPKSAAVDATGVYIADGGNNRLLWYPGTSTTAARVYGQNGNFTTATTATTSTNLSGVFGVALDASGVYLVDQGNNRVLYFGGTSTTATRVYGQLGSFSTATVNVTADGLNQPGGVAVDATGVYIADTANYRVLYYAGTSTTATRVYGQGGVFTTANPNSGGVLATSLNSPRSVKVFSDGIYIVDAANHRVLMY